VGGKLEHLPPAPTREVWIFKGWFTAATGGTQVTTSYAFSGNSTIYAHWALPEGVFEITLDPTTSGLVSTSVLTGADGKIHVQLPMPTKTDSLLIGWYTRPANDELSYDANDVYIFNRIFTENTVIYAHWKHAESRHVIFQVGWRDVDNGTYHVYYVLSAYTDEEGKLQLKSLPEEPTREGYRFIGWGGSTTLETVFTGSVYMENNVVALWEWTGDPADEPGWVPEVRFDPRGGTMKEPTEILASNGREYFIVKVDADGKASVWPEDPTRENYDFVCWTYGLADACTNKDYPFGLSGSSSIVNAKWQWSSFYTITFDPTGGTTLITSAQTIVENWKLQSLPVPERSGYTFDGWFTAATGGTKVDETTEFRDGNRTVYAQWTESDEPQTRGQFYDNRGEGTYYKWTIINGKKWMAENLRYDVPDVTPATVCWTQYDATCENFGRYYTWAAAMGFVGSEADNSASSFNQTRWGGSDENHQGVCPDEWHLPSAAEWQELLDYVGTGSDLNKLKTTGITGAWSAGSDDFGFAAYPSGYNANDGRNTSAYWWTATEGSYDYQAKHYVISHNGGASTANAPNGRFEERNKSDRLTVRCVAD
jgi:uncharacterized protein (TIGR02145 family)/uncharacterized repeat protein (TIGR02543 family)